MINIEYRIISSIIIAGIFNIHAIHYIQVVYVFLILLPTHIFFMDNNELNIKILLRDVINYMRVLIFRLFLMAEHAMWWKDEIWWRKDVFGLKTCCFAGWNYENILLLSSWDWFCSSPAVSFLRLLNFFPEQHIIAKWSLFGPGLGKMSINLAVDWKLIPSLQRCVTRV